ncbi:hypothetical protein SAMN04487944_101125 [Gracilibacillus ureilyticus]|uniref:Flagellar Assembly Protein A N-terminal region domain-containing protein n=1 Tax=Gracilibacillus ureilyticus TaxID=531814 RepID=A0A1H9L6L3_9BACI|nr:FapA family protein [Gracilibacillus ureilyticus]SER07056.1 hypothetical protein SAMN04487944_101125 [Gracilibacillus ureilyticus]
MEKMAVGLKVAKDRLKVFIELLDRELLDELEIEDLFQLLEKEKISSDLIVLDETNWKLLLTEHQVIQVAEGISPTNGQDGYINWKLSFDSQLSEKEKTSFRDVKKIPSVTEGTILAEIVPPTEGSSGLDVYGNIIKQRKGKKVTTKAGKNVELNENEFIAEKDGKLSVTDKLIQVFDMFELDGDITLKTGNIDFVGSVYIRGNVPSGYQVKAQGDIHVIGLVEGAYLKAGGNILINEGISGMDSAVIQADGDIKTNYINQASVEAGNNLIAAKSILHSQCVAQESILCENGSIIGGTCSAGKQIVVNNLGNFANTKTVLALGINKNKREELESLKQELAKLTENKKKLQFLGKQLHDKKEKLGNLNAKERIMLLKQRNMYDKSVEQINNIQAEIDEMQYSIGNYTDLEVIVKGKAFDNVEFIFGKYSRKLTREYKYFKSYIKEMEITIDSL